MKAAKILIGLIIALYVGFFLVGQFLPKTTSMARSIEINASPQVVFSFVGTQKSQQAWSPWAEYDKEMKVNFAGEPIGVGATMNWQSEHPKVGIGSSVVTLYEPYERIDVTLQFGQHSAGNASIQLQALSEDAVKVTWTYSTRHDNLFEKYFGLMLDGMLGAEYEKGLAKLKTMAEAAPTITTRVFEYTVEGTTLTGYIAEPRGNLDNIPAVLVVHEWWGHNEYARKRADMLAELGYVAMAIDMYGDGKLADHPEDAKKFMMEVGANTALAGERFDAALTILAAQPGVSPLDIAAIGYCFGGSVVLNMARAGKPLKGVASFHGGLGGLLPVSHLSKAKQLILNGAADPMISAEDIESFKTGSAEQGVEFEFVNYPGAKHAFTNPSATELGEKYGLPLAYDEQADKESWARLVDFLSSIF